VGDRRASNSGRRGGHGEPGSAFVSHSSCSMGLTKHVLAVQTIKGRSAIAPRSPSPQNPPEQGHRGAGTDEEY